MIQVNDLNGRLSNAPLLLVVVVVLLVLLPSGAVGRFAP